MPYIALKSVKFDREYLVGEIIPDQAVDAGRASALEGMKLIARTAAQEPAETPAETGEDKTPVAPEAGAETAQEPAGDAQNDGKGNEPTEPETAAETAQEPAEGEKKPKGKK